MNENTTPINEMQQDFRQLRDSIERHSHFDTEAWHKVLVDTRRLRRLQISSAIVLIIMMTLAATILYLSGQLPLWFAVLVAVAFDTLGIYALIDARSLRLSRTQSQQALAELSQSLDPNSQKSKRLLNIIKAASTPLLIGIFIFAFKSGGASQVVGLIITLAISAPLTKLLAIKPIQKRLKTTKHNIDSLSNPKE